MSAPPESWIPAPGEVRKAWRVNPDLAYKLVYEARDRFDALDPRPPRDQALAAKAALLAAARALRACHRPSDPNDRPEPIRRRVVEREDLGDGHVLVRERYPLARDRYDRVMAVAPVARQREASGRQPVRRRGSRRATAASRAGPDDDPDPEPDQLQLVPEGRTWRLSDRREIAAWIAEQLETLDRAKGRR
jgi:hypothetical protein